MEKHVSHHFICQKKCYIYFSEFFPIFFSSILNTKTIKGSGLIIYLFIEILSYKHSLEPYTSS